MIEKTNESFAALTEILDTLGGGSRCVSRGPGRGAAHLETVKTVCAGLVVCGCVCVCVFAAVCLCVTNAVHHLGAAIWWHHLSLPH